MGRLRALYGDRGEEQRGGGHGRNERWKGGKERRGIERRVREEEKEREEKNDRGRGGKERRQERRECEGEKLSEREDRDKRYR